MVRPPATKIRASVYPIRRPTIAAVYRNRLRRSMPLDADPTVEYAFLLRDGERKGRLSDGDYQIDSPWNTYRRTGLPPGPVGNPGSAAVDAALRPAATSYLYFVSKKDGTHHFSATLDEHNKAVRKYLR